MKVKFTVVLLILFFAITGCDFNGTGGEPNSLRDFQPPAMEQFCDRLIAQLKSPDQIIEYALSGNGDNAVFLIETQKNGRVPAEVATRVVSQFSEAFDIVTKMDWEKFEFISPSQFEVSEPTPTNEHVYVILEFEIRPKELLPPI